MSPAKSVACGSWVMLIVLTTWSGAGAETLRKLSRKQISTKLTGMEFSDEVHWREVYERNGSMRSYEMGRSRECKWRVVALTGYALISKALGPRIAINFG
jgi:hypothetical protein